LIFAADRGRVATMVKDGRRTRHSSAKEPFFCGFV
jgi:hypothetical protein